MSQIDMWSSLKQLGTADEVILHRFIGRDRPGGHTMDVFDPDGEEIDAVIRPWQDDLPTMEQTGQTGHTPGFKLYADQDDELKRNDRIHWEGGAFRVTNPQHCGFAGFTRWDIRTDEREFLTLDELPEVSDETDLEAPPEGRFGDY